jgi:hypothetical protein
MDAGAIGDDFLVAGLGLEGPGAGRRIPLAGPIELGRDPELAHPLPDELVSRRHARVEPEPGGAVIRRKFSPGVPEILAEAASCPPTGPRSHRWMPWRGGTPRR